MYVYGAAADTYNVALRLRQSATEKSCCVGVDEKKSP